MAQQLEAGEHPLQAGRRAGALTFVEHSPDCSAMSLAAARFDGAGRAGWIRHDGHPGLRAHVINAVKRPLPAEKWRYDRPSR